MEITVLSKNNNIKNRNRQGKFLSLPVFNNIKMKNLKTYQIFLIFILFFLTLCIYLPMLNAGYSPTDDRLMLKSHSGALKKINFDYILNTFTHYHEGLYHPLVTLSYSLEVGIFGFVPAIFHLDNILLHIVNVVLVFLIFLKLSKNFWVSFIVTALFAIHPTRVEVVAWISARKDLLYAPFYLLSILFYLKHNEELRAESFPTETFGNDTTKESVISIAGRNLSLSSSGITKVHNRQYRRLLFLSLSIFLFLLSCFSKSMAITLPFVLILIDWYTNNLSKERTKIYIVYIIFALIFVLITIQAHYYSEYKHAQFNLNSFGYAVNFINSHFNILFYLDKLLLPINLYCVYPYFYNMSDMPPGFIMYSPVVLYLLIYLICLSLKKTKLMFFGFMFFIITILPTSGIFPIGNFVVADRYTYIPYLGLFFFVAEFLIFIKNKICHLFQKSVFRYLFISSIIGFCVFISGLLGQISYNRILDWKENIYGAPKEMKYYEFGINKKSGKGLKSYRANRKQKK